MKNPNIREVRGEQRFLDADTRFDGPNMYYAYRDGPILLGRQTRYVYGVAAASHQALEDVLLQAYPEREVDWSVLTPAVV